MGWFEDFFDDTLDVVADAVVGVSSAAIDTAVKARQAGVVFPPGEAVADFWDVDMEDAVSAAESQGQYLTDEDVDVNVPSLTVVKLKKVLQASIYAACETFLLRNEL